MTVKDVSFIPDPAVLAQLAKWGWTDSARTPPEVYELADTALRTRRVGNDPIAVLVTLGVMPADRAEPLRQLYVGSNDPYQALADHEPAIDGELDRIRATLAGEAYYPRLSVLAAHPAMSVAAVAQRCDQRDVALMATADGTPVLMFGAYDRLVSYRSRGRQDVADDPIVQATDGRLLYALASSDDISGQIKHHQSRETHTEDGNSNRWLIDDTHSPEGRLLKRLINNAVTLQATDISFDPMDDYSYGLRVRQWGKLISPTTVSPVIGSALAPRVLQLLQRYAGTSLKNVRVREPTDGHITYISAGMPEINIRASFIPLGHLGETRDVQSISLRLLPKTSASVQVADLRLQERVVQHLGEAIRVPQGLIVLAGPMNSGKSTTIAGAVGMHVDLYGDSKKRVSAEDPVERTVAGVTQINIPTTLLDRDGRKLSEQERFNLVLRSVKRHDVNMLWVGEVRDRESAEFCTAFSASGHLVLTTIHAQDELSAFDILSTSVTPDLRFQLCESLSLIVSQRLIHTLCPACKQPAQTSQRDIDRFGVRLKALGETHELPTTHFAAKPGGCPACNHTGYGGHTPINGVLAFDRATKDAAILQVTKGDLEARRYIAQARAQTLFGSGLDQLRAGVCDLDSVLYF